MQVTSGTQKTPVGATAAASRAMVEAAVVERMGRAFSDLANRVDRQALDAAARARTDVDALMTLLYAPAAVELVTHDDPLADARLRWVRDRERLLHAEGTPLTTRQVMEILGVTRQAVARARQDGRLVALPLGTGRYVYPSWQFGPSGPVKGLRELQRALDDGDAGPWTLTAFVLAPNSRLDGDTPLNVLRRGEVESVLNAARAYGEQGAA